MADCTLCDPRFWLEIANAVALIVTLIFVVRNTNASVDMARATEKMVDLQHQDFVMRNRPRVTLRCEQEELFHFPIAIWNSSGLHAKARVRATIVINGLTMKLPEGHVYDGIHIWDIPAVATDRPFMYGHLDLLTVCKFNGIRDIDPAGTRVHNASIVIESWVTNFYLEDSDLSLGSSKGPTLKWDWTSSRGRWIPDVSVRGKKSGED